MAPYSYTDFVEALRSKSTAQGNRGLMTQGKGIGRLMWAREPTVSMEVRLESEIDLHEHPFINASININPNNLTV